MALYDSTVSVSLPCHWKMSEPLKAIIIRVTEIKLHVLRQNCYKVNLKILYMLKIRSSGQTVNK
jgi:hypothetical protein